MSKRVGVLATIVAAMIGSLALPSGATAATEFGDNCVADYFELKVPYLLYEGSNASNPLPVSAPSSGVITKWKVNIMPTPGSGLLRLAAVHTGLPGITRIGADRRPRRRSGPSAARTRSTRGYRSRPETGSRSDPARAKS